MPHANMDAVNTTKVQELESRLDHLQELAKARYHRFTDKKKEEGYFRKTFWLRLSKEEFDELVLWLKAQNDDDLKDFIYLLKSEMIDLRALINSYRELKKLAIEHRLVPRVREKQCC